LKTNESRRSLKIVLY